MMWHRREVRAQCEYARVENYSKQGEKEDTKETESKKNNRKKRSNITNHTETHLIQQRNSSLSCSILTNPTFLHVDSHQRTNIWKLQNGGLIFKTFKMAVNQQLTGKKKRKMSSIPHLRWCLRSTYVHSITGVKNTFRVAKNTHL